MARDWDRELAKIDRQLESISDDALRPGAPPAPGARVPASAGGRGAEPTRPLAGRTPPAPLPGEARTRTLGVVLRLLLASALAVGVLFWPYEAACGAGLAGYLGAVAVVGVAGAWSAVWSWRHRSARAHVIALGLVGRGRALAAAEVLPRVGYAKADPARTRWICE